MTALDVLTYAGDEAQPRPDARPRRPGQGDIAYTELVDRLVADTDVVMRSAAESPNDNSLRGSRVRRWDGYLTAIVLARVLPTTGLLARRRSRGKGTS